MDGGEFVSNVASVTGTFTTPSGITGTITTVSDDPTTGADDDPTKTDLDNESAVEVTKTFTTTDKNGNGLKDVGDIINYTVAIENKGQTSLGSLTLIDSFARADGTTQTLEVNRAVEGATNLFTYSGYWYYSYNGWSKPGNYNNGGVGGSAWRNQFAPAIEYYFSTASGRNHNRVDQSMPNIGYGITTASYDSESRLFSMYTLQEYGIIYRSYNFEPNTTYTFSVYAKANNSTMATRPFYLAVWDGSQGAYQTGSSGSWTSTHTIKTCLLYTSPSPRDRG